MSPSSLITARSPVTTDASNGAGRRVVNGLAGLALAATAAAGLSAPAGAAEAEPVRLVALGDSLVAGYGLPPEQGFVPQLEEALRARGYGVDVIDAGVSGDTTAGGLARLDWVLADNPDMMLVELGANDGLRGIDPAEVRANLSAILARLTDEGIPTLLAGMYAPPNFGPDYSAAFDSIYPELAEEYDVHLYPFFLEGVAAEPSLNQPDGIHPNAEGVRVIVGNILPEVIAVLEDAGLAERAQAAAEGAAP
jgi:acyl-CoA thioesterase-1